MSTRSARIERATKETQITVAVNLDGTGRCELNSGLPFLDHMLDQVARHGVIDLEVKAQGDLEIDAHHTVEDIGITLGQALRQQVIPRVSVVDLNHITKPTQLPDILTKQNLHKTRLQHLIYTHLSTKDSGINARLPRRPLVSSLNQATYGSSAINRARLIALFTFR